jgi:hypothetical protein
MGSIVLLTVRSFIYLPYFLTIRMVNFSDPAVVEGDIGVCSSHPFSQTEKLTAAYRTQPSAVLKKFLILVDGFFM